MTGQPYHHGNLRAALLERAEEIIERDGVEHLSLRALARDIGVSHSAFARHFHDRDALLDALALSGFERLNAELRAVVPADIDDLTTVIEALGHTYIRFAVEHPGLIDTMYAAKLDQDATPLLAEQSHVPMLLLIDVITQAQQAGRVRIDDPRVLATVVFAAVHGAAVVATRGLLQDLTWEQAADATVRLTLRGLAP